MLSPPRTLAELCVARAASHGQAEAVSDGSVSITYGELATSAAATAQRLRDLGVQPGDRVALQGRNQTAWVVAAFGILLAGASVVPIGRHVPEAARSRLLAELTVRLLVSDGDAVCDVAVVELGDLVGEVGSADVAPRVGDPDPDTEALVLMSSGTTGEPKLVSMSHRQLLDVYAEVVERLGVTTGDRLLGAVPLAHSFGFNGVLLVSMLAGAMVRLVPSYDRNALPGLAVAERLGVVSGTPQRCCGILWRPTPTSAAWSTWW